MIGFEKNLENAKKSAYFLVSEKIVRLQTTMIVPAKPNLSGTMFVWPGLQSVPWAENWAPIFNGVLQPVLTWGSTCAPAPNKPENYSTWWISGQYVNTDPNSPPEIKGCHSGKLITADPGDYLFIDMSLNENTNIWTQEIINQRTGEQADYSIDLKGQCQQAFEFFIEPYYGSKMNSPVTFIHTTVTCAKPINCDDIKSNGLMSPPVCQDGGLSCFISSIVLKQNIDISK